MANETKAAPTTEERISALEKVIETQSRDFSKFQKQMSDKLVEIAKTVNTAIAAKTTPKKSTDARLDRIEAAITRNTGERFPDE